MRGRPPAQAPAQNCYLWSSRMATRRCGSFQQLPRGPFRSPGSPSATSPLHALSPSLSPPMGCHWLRATMAVFAALARFQSAILLLAAWPPLPPHRYPLHNPALLSGRERLSLHASLVHLPRTTQPPRTEPDSTAATRADAPAVTVSGGGSVGNGWGSSSVAEPLPVGLRHLVELRQTDSLAKRCRLAAQLLGNEQVWEGAQLMKQAQWAQKAVVDAVGAEGDSKCSGRSGSRR